MFTTWCAVYSRDCSWDKQTAQWAWKTPRVEPRKRRRTSFSLKLARVWICNEETRKPLIICNRIYKSEFPQKLAEYLLFANRKTLLAENWINTESFLWGDECIFHCSAKVSTRNSSESVGVVRRKNKMFSLSFGRYLWFMSCFDKKNFMLMERTQSYFKNISIDATGNFLVGENRC